LQDDIETKLIAQLLVNVAIVAREVPMSFTLVGRQGTRRCGGYDFEEWRLVEN
jgi:hypothetical protein